MRISDTEFRCDRCGGDCGNGGVTESLVASDVDDDNPGMVVNHHFCRDQVDEDGKVIKKGCRNKVLSAANLKYYLEVKEKESK